MIAACVLGLGLLALVPVAGELTKKGGFAAERLSALASSPGIRVTIGQVGFAFPAALTLSDIVVADDSGPWLKAGRITLEPKIRPLLRGEADLRLIAIDTAEILRLPETKAPETKPPEAKAAATSSAPPVHIEALTIGRLGFEHSVTLAVEGRDLALDASRKSGTLHLRRLDGGEGHADLKLLYGTANKTLDLAASIDEPTGLLADRLLGRSDHAGLALDIEGTGPLTRWQGRLKAGLGELLHLDTAVAIMQGEGGRIGVEADGKMASGLVPPSLRGWTGEQIPFVTALSLGDGNRVSVEKLSLSLAMGELSGGFSYDPATAALVGTAKLSGGKLAEAKLNATAMADFSLKEGRFLTIPKLRIAAKDTAIDGSLEADLADKAVSGHLTGHAAELASWSGLLGTRLGGRLDLDLSLDRGQKGALTLQGSRLVFGDKIRAENVAARIDLAHLDLGHPETIPTGNARMLVTGATLPGGSLSRVEIEAASAPSGPFHLETRLEGKFGEKVTVAAGGDLALAKDRQSLALTRLTGFYGGDRIALEHTLRLERRPGAYSFNDLALAFGPGGIKGQGSIEGKRQSLHLSATGMPAALVARLAGHPGEITGEIGAEADIGGSLDAPEGRITIDGQKLALAAAGRPDLPLLSIVAEADWRRGMVTARGRIAGPKDAAIGFSGTAPLSLDGPISARIEGEGELGYLQDMLPLGEDRIAGAFQIALNLGGTVAGPRAEGSMRLSRGRYESLRAGILLQGIELELAGNNERLEFRHFTADDGKGGTLKAQGGIDLGGAAGTGVTVKDVSVAAELTRFVILGRDDAHAEATGHINLTGTLSAPLIAGKLRVDKAEIQIPERLPPRIAALDVIRIDSSGRQIIPVQAPAEKPSALSVPLALDIDMPGQVFVRGRGLDSEWKGRMAVGGTSSDPALTGNLEAIRGNYAFIGTTFLVTQGVVTFTGGGGIDPGIDITADNTGNGITAEVRIGGTASAPTVKLTSQPQLPQDEILARVLFGQSLGQVTAAQGLQIAQIAGSLATGGGPGVLDTIRRGLGLDVLSFGKSSSLLGTNATANAVGSGLPPPAGSTAASSSSSGGVLGGSALSAGKYVAPGVYVGVAQGLSMGSSAATIQFELTPHLSLKTEIGRADSGSGLGLDWKLDY